MTIADELRGISTAKLWAVTGTVVAVLGGISAAIGQGGDGNIRSVAGYTLPLTAGFAVITFALISGLGEKVPGMFLMAGAALVLWGAGVAAGALGFAGMTFGEVAPSGGPQKLFGSVLEVYLNAYGWPLMISALAIGIAVAVHVERWLTSQVPNVS